MSCDCSNGCLRSKRRWRVSRRWCSPRWCSPRWCVSRRRLPWSGRTPWSGGRRRCRRRRSCCRRLLWRATVRILPLSTLLLDILVVLQGPAAQHKAATGSEIQPDRPRASVIQIGSISAGCLRRKNLGASRPNLEFGSRRFVVAARHAGTGKAMSAQDKGPFMTHWRGRMVIGQSRLAVFPA